MRTKLIWSIAALTLSLALALGAGPAAAETPHAGQLAFSGTMTMSPGWPPFPATGGTGSFAFSGSCITGSAWVSGGDDPNGLDPVEAGTCTTITFSGVLSAVFCGTAEVTGTAIISNVTLLPEPPTEPQEGTLTANVAISFINGVGTLTISDGNWDGDPVVTGGGTAMLTNLPGESCLGPGPVTGFSISGALTVIGEGGTAQAVAHQSG